MKILTITESRLAELLTKAGIKKSPTAYLAEDREDARQIAHIQKRISASYWSRYWLLTTVLFSFFSLITSGFNVEDFFCVSLFTTMTIVEFKVHEWFKEGSPNAAFYGYINQTTFAVFFLIYGAYHSLTVAVPQEITSALGAQTGQAFLGMAKFIYLTIGIVGAIGQYWLATFYRRKLKPIS